MRMKNWKCRMKNEAKKFNFLIRRSEKTRNFEDKIEIENLVLNLIYVRKRCNQEIKLD